jgi:uncharacterized membrane protein
MIWVGLIGGVVIGALIGELEGAITLGFLGWLTGFIIKSQKTKPGPGTGQVLVPGVGQVPDATVQPIHDYSNWPLKERVARLEQTVARLEAQLAGAAAAPVASAGIGPRAIAAGAAPGATSEQGPGATSEQGLGAIGEQAAGATSESAPGTTSEPTVAPDAAAAATVGGPISLEPPPPPPTPPTPNPIIAWLTGGNTIARVGLLILFIGLAFLLKYAADQRLLPPELRLAAVAAGGIALLFLGWRLRLRNPGYALGMQGAGVAVLYLTTFGALRLYSLIPPEAAFLVLAGIAVFSAILAVRQDAVALAVIGAGGGFLAPILASTGKGSHVMLFSYYLVLNLGILAIAWHKAWRSLNLTGFVFTFGIFTAWVLRSYSHELYDSTQPFLAAFFVLYVALAILVAREKEEGARRYVDGTLVFGAPLAAFALQARLTDDTEYGLAISALVVAAFYIGLAWALLRTRRESWKLLAQSFIALGVVFATVAIPLALDARWTSASWAAEGAAILWICLKQGRTLGRAFGLLLQFLAAIAYLLSSKQHGDIAIADAAFLGAAIIALASLWAHRLLLNNKDAVTAGERLLIVPLFLWGLVWLVGAGLDEIDAHVPGDYSLAAALGYITAVAFVFGQLALRWSWREAAWTAKAFLPTLYVAAALMVFRQEHAFAGGGWIAWPIALGILAWVLRRIDPDDKGDNATALHAGAAILVAFLGAWEGNWLAAEYTAHGTAWSSGAAAFLPSVVVLLISLRALDDRWPIGEHPRAYRLWAAGAIAAWLAAWSLFANFTHDARSDPLPYMPVINALDLAHVFAILCLVAAWKAAGRSGIDLAASVNRAAVATIGGSLGFIWLTAILLRTVSHWGGVPYTQSAMMSSRLAQASLSIFWAVLALAAMVYATRTARRPVWIVGAVLMGVVVAKLFLVDLSNVGGIERIVSFIAVGVLMLVIGYFSPVPPRKTETQPQ